MAASLGGLCAIWPSNLLLTPSPPSGGRRQTAGYRRRRRYGGGCKAMVQQQTFQGSPANYAREMERLSAKESLLLAFNDAGGFQSLVGGKTTELQRIDVNERIIGLERLNPTPRPTTRSPATWANLSGLDMVIKDGSSKVTAKLKFLNSIESKFLITTRLSVEGPIRMKEEYTEGILETPTVSEQAIPEQLKGAIGQATGTLQQLPAPIKDALSNGLKVPLSGTFQRLFMISYLDEEILIIRDSAGAPDVLTRLEALPAPLANETVAEEYDS